MYYNMITGDRVTEIPAISGGDFWASLPADYEWQTWCFDGSTYRKKTQEELDAEITAHKRELTDKLWYDCNTYAEAQMDYNSRHSINLYLVDPTLPPSRLLKIQQYAGWWTSIWGYYAIQKQKILNGEDAVFDPSVVGPCPYTIWEIAAPVE